MGYTLQREATTRVFEAALTARLPLRLGQQRVQYNGIRHATSGAQGTVVLRCEISSGSSESGVCRIRISGLPCRRHPPTYCCSGMCVLHKLDASHEDRPQPL